MEIILDNEKEVYSITLQEQYNPNRDKTTENTHSISISELVGTTEICRFLAVLGSADDALDVLIEYDEDNDNGVEDNINNENKELHW